MPKKNPKEPRVRPFPWPCSICFTPTVVPTVIDYTAKVKHDGVVHEFHLPRLEVPRCRTCGETIITTAVDEQINKALRSRLGLLTPTQIRKNIEKLGLNQQALAEWLDVAPETISRWVNGALIQSMRMNKRLRMFFAFPEARDMLRRLDQDPQLGIEVCLEAGESKGRFGGEDCQAAIAPPRRIVFGGNDPVPETATPEPIMPPLRRIVFAPQDSVGKDCPEPIAQRLQTCQFEYAMKAYGEEGLRAEVALVRGWGSFFLLGQE